MIYNILYRFKLLSFIHILPEAKYFSQKLSTLVKKKNNLFQSFIVYFLILTMETECRWG